MADKNWPDLASWSRSHSRIGSWVILCYWFRFWLFWSSYSSSTRWMLNNCHPISRRQRMTKFNRRKNTCAAHWRQQSSSDADSWTSCTGEQFQVSRHFWRPIWAHNCCFRFFGALSSSSFSFRETDLAHCTNCPLITTKWNDFATDLLSFAFFLALVARPCAPQIFFDGSCETW